jgi:hypothetical protein
MFVIVDDDTLFFRADDGSRPAFERAGKRKGAHKVLRSGCPPEDVAARLRLVRLDGAWQIGHYVGCKSNPTPNSRHTGREKQ